MITKHIPNAITCLNLFSGCMAVYFAFNGAVDLALLFILLAAVFDFLDGFAARLLKAYSPMGKELDSLADMISFGFAPGAMVFAFLSSCNITCSSCANYLPFVGFLITIFSALRLAKFNIDERQTTEFIGVPTPANALFWGGLFYSYANYLQTQPYVVVILAVCTSLLLVAELPLFSLKFKNLNWKENQDKFVFLLGCIFLIVFFRVNALIWLILWYLTLSVIMLIIKRIRGCRA